MPLFLSIFSLNFSLFSMLGKAYGWVTYLCTSGFLIKLIIFYVQDFHLIVVDRSSTLAIFL